MRVSPCRNTMAVTTQSKATENIIYFTIQYMGISKQTAFNEASIASYVVAMLPDKYVSTIDILDACSAISERYAYVDPDRLAVELSDRILKREPQSNIKIGALFIAVGAYLTYKYVLNPKKW